jgi:Ser/Thr protein kinase RdoA (MazF antagonist)
MSDPADLASLVTAAFDVRNPAVHPLPNSWEGQVYLVTGSGGPWVLRKTDSVACEHDIQVLSYLERHAYPAPRLVRTTHGAERVRLGTESILVTTFIEGTQADFSPSTLHKLGERLGQLHSLPLDSDRTLPTATMLPAPDMKLALSWLEPVAHGLSPSLGETYDRLLDAIHAIGDFSRLPQTLIHNDAHPGNAIVTPDCDAVFIDWHGSGIGPPIVDLGFLLISSEIAPSWSDPLMPNRQRVDAIVDGYARFRRPTDAELDLLPDAMRFRGLLYGAGHLRQTVAQESDTLTESWWWERYQIADELAERARGRLGVGRS